LKIENNKIKVKPLLNNFFLCVRISVLQTGISLKIFLIHLYGVQFPQNLQARQPATAWVPWWWAKAMLVKDYSIVDPFSKNECGWTRAATLLFWVYMLVTVFCINIYIFFYLFIYNIQVCKVCLHPVNFENFSATVLNYER